MNIYKIIENANDILNESGKENVPFFLSKKKHKTVLDAANLYNNKNDNQVDRCAVHTAILEHGLELADSLKFDEAYNFCTQLRIEKATEPRGPSGFVIAKSTHDKIKKLAKDFSVKNGEAHFIAYCLGLTKFENKK
jgi:hypothetical protein